MRTEGGLSGPTHEACLTPVSPAGSCTSASLPSHPFGRCCDLLMCLPLVHGLLEDVWSISKRSTKPPLIHWRIQNARRQSARGSVCCLQFAGTRLSLMNPRRSLPASCCRHWLPGLLRSEPIAIHGRVGRTLGESGMLDTASHRVASHADARELAEHGGNRNLGAHQPNLGRWIATLGEAGRHAATWPRDRNHRKAKIN